MLGVFLLKEYEEALLLCKKQKKQNKQLIMLTVLLIVLGSMFVLVDIIRINPMVVFLLLLLIVIGYAIKTRVTSTQYDNLLKFLKRYQPAVLKRKEMVMFIDQQLSKKYETVELRKLLKSKEADNKFISKIEDMIFLFDALENGDIEKVSSKKKSRKKKSKSKKRTRGKKNDI